MTLPQNVANAVGNIDACRLETFDDDWLTIRDHLMRQEAEIADLISKRDFLLRHYNGAESRLAAANALLRDLAMGHGVMDDRIQAHLQGAGDEA